MSTPSSPPYDDIVRNTFPLTFKEHAFSSYCSNTIGCRVLYADMYDTHDKEDEVSPPPPRDWYKTMYASRGPIRNFPPPAIVTWRSLDGVPHKAEIDIGEIFKDQRVRYTVPDSELPIDTAATAGEPDIILIVNDRTISVYMKIDLLLKTPRDPNVRGSNLVTETTLAYTHTY